MIMETTIKKDLFLATDTEWNSWQWQLSHRLKHTDDLKRLPWLRAEALTQISQVIENYPWSVTPYFLSLIKGEDPEDPIRRQVIPAQEELSPAGKGRLDPLGEADLTVLPGLIHRYPDRVVLLTSHHCAVNCRHCFRKRLWQESPIIWDDASLSAVERYLQEHTEIRDILLSGGDPLMQADESLDHLLGRLRRIAHIDIVRIGSRMPAVLPQRITPELCRVLDSHGPIWLNTQFNHPREITPEAALACERLLRAGVPVGNQTVLLKGVNDSAETIQSLCRALLRIRVRPYYLHQCDQVAGTEHFRTPLDKGIEIIGALQGVTSGLAIPRFMVDLPGKGGKIPLQLDYILASGGGRYLLRNYAGELYGYEDKAAKKGIG